MEKNNWLYIIIIALIAALVVVNVAKFDTGRITSKEDTRTITASGTASKDVDPNKVEIGFSVETKASNAEEAQRENAQLVASAKKTLLDLGFSEKDIETSYFNVGPEHQYNYQTGEQKFVDYKAVHTLKFTSKDIQKAGKIIDALTKAGVNRVDYVQFGLDDAKENDIKKAVMTDASNDALSKANAMASGTGTRIKHVVSVSEANYYYPPLRMDMAMMKANAIGNAAPETSLSPGTIKVSATVNVVYSIE